MINYSLHKKLGLCTKCSAKQFKNTVYCRKHWLGNLYNNLVERCRNQTNPKNRCYAGVSVRFTRKEFLEWAILQEFDSLNKPSLDRLDSTKDYEFGNIRFCELDANVAKEKLTFTETTGKCFVCQRTLPIERFVRDSRRRNGRTSICLTCERNRKYDPRSYGP